MTVAIVAASPRKEIADMKEEINNLKFKATSLKKKMARNQEQWVETFQAMQHQEDTLTVLCKSNANDN